MPLTRPRVRDYLVRHQEITFDDYTDSFSLAFDLSWPYDDRQVIAIDESPGPGAAHHKINAVFMEHIRNIGNWTVGPRYWQKYPALREAVEEDVREFGKPSFENRTDELQV